MAPVARWPWIFFAGILFACGGTVVSGTSADAGGNGGRSNGPGGTGGSSAGTGGSSAGTGGSSAGTGGVAGSSSAGTGGGGGCPAGYADCNGKSSDGCEAHLASDPDNCGACGRMCTSANGAPACVNGACRVCACSRGRGDCNHDCADGCEANLMTDVANCGSCGHSCAAVNGTAICTNGKCAIRTCDTGYADCDGLYSTGCETNLAVDPQNCGRCGTVCSLNGGPGTCDNGRCSFMCCDQIGYANCDGDCASGCQDLMTDPQNCGYCGHACASGQHCVSGRCQ